MAKANLQMNNNATTVPTPLTFTPVHSFMAEL